LCCAHLRDFTLGYTRVKPAAPSTPSPVAVSIAFRLAALNLLAVARQHLGSLDKVTRIVRLGVSIATSRDVRDQPKVADAASELLQDVFEKDKNPCRLVYGVASLPLCTPVELEDIFEVGG
jgi:enamine deaminase RidA (YjgF/YER057c/UK114 family)